MDSKPGRGFLKSHRKMMALEIALIYAIVSGLWILLSDRMVFTITSDRRLATALSIYKGWGFVIITALLLYALINSMTAQIAKSDAEAAYAKRQFYRSTVYSVTEGRLDLCSRDEIESELPRNVQHLRLSSREDLQRLRESVKQLTDEVNMPADQTHLFITAVGEAAANAIKHAGGGVVRLGIKDATVEVCVQDHGPGIDELTLPKATLMHQYSTARSMGLGYSLILASASRVYLATDPDGTWVLIEKSPSKPKPEANLDALPDTW